MSPPRPVQAHERRQNAASPWRAHQPPVVDVVADESVVELRPLARAYVRFLLEAEGITPSAASLRRAS
jgi:hypothetical protein